jgi:hypothetical protein
VLDQHGHHDALHGQAPHVLHRQTAQHHPGHTKHQLSLSASSPNGKRQLATNLSTIELINSRVRRKSSDEKTIDQIQKLINSRGRRKTCISAMEEGVEIENVTEKMMGKRRTPGYFDFDLIASSATPTPPRPTSPRRGRRMLLRK